jgi:hypothetical protein
MRLLLFVALLLPVAALPQEGGRKGGPPPEPKNLKVLTGMDGARVIQVMRAMNAGLGVQCT